MSAQDGVVSVTASTAHALLRLRGETAGRALAELIVRRYASMNADEKTAFFEVLLSEFGADRGAVDAAISTYQSEPSEMNTVALAEAADALRLNLFRAINTCLLYTSPSPRDATLSRMPSSA